MELLPTLEKGLEAAKNIGINTLKFVLHRLDGAHGGWSDLPAPANITVNGEQLDEQAN